MCCDVSYTEHFLHFTKIVSLTKYPNYDTYVKITVNVM